MSIRTTYEPSQRAILSSSCLDVPGPAQENIASSRESHRQSYHRAVSSTSVLSAHSMVVHPLRVRNENVVPSRTISLSTIDFCESLTSNTATGKSCSRVSHKSSWNTDILLPPQPRDTRVSGLITDTLEDIDLGTDCAAIKEISENNATEFLECPSSRPETSILGDKGNESKTPGTSDKSHPFRRWMQTIHRKSNHPHWDEDPHNIRWLLAEFDEPDTRDTVLLQSPVNRRHKKSSSWASSAFVTAVRSASISLATLSVAPQSSKMRGSTHVRSSNRSSRLSHSLNRWSIDETSNSTHMVDEASRQRATKRRQILEELVESEESYVADLKVLVNVRPHRSFARLPLLTKLLRYTLLFWLPLLLPRLRNWRTYMKTLPGSLLCMKIYSTACVSLYLIQKWAMFHKKQPPSSMFLDILADTASTLPWTNGPTVLSLMSGAR
jgi:hypothetical protein